MAMPITYYDQGRSVRMGILGFAVGLGLASLTAAAINLGRLETGMYRLIMAIVYGLAGLFAGMLFGATLRSRQMAVLCGLFGALGVGGGYYLSQFLTAPLDPNALTPFLGPEIGPLALPFVQFTLIGLCTGAMLGLAQGKAQQLVRGGLAGTLGFGLAYVVQVAAFSLLLNVVLAPLFGFLTGGGGGLLAVILSWSIAGGLGGVVAGMILGEALA